jgi:hypothetical protein
MPFRGGADDFKVRQLFQQYQDKQQEDARKAADEERKGRLDEAHIAKLNAPEGLTLYQQESLRLRQAREDRLGGKHAAGKDYISKAGLTLDDLNTPDLIRYENQDGTRQMSSAQAAADPEHAWAAVPGKKPMAYKQWNAAADSFRRAQGAPTPTPAPVTDTSATQPTARTTPIPANPSGEVPIQVRTVDEARKYPSGTLIMTPDGRQGRVP